MLLSRRGSFERSLQDIRGVQLHGIRPQLAFEAELGMATPLGKWSLEAMLGVIFFTDNDDFLMGRTLSQEVLYVGKARNLKNRVGSYFRASGLATKTMALVSRIDDIQVTVTTTEVDALLLEHNLIKTEQPPYNILLRDDKSYPYIFLSSDDKYPRLSLHRGAKRRKGKYFGPYPSASAVRESLHFLQKVFRVRQCEDSYFRNRSRPCLQYQIDRCTAPCVDLVSEEEYREQVDNTSLFLRGKSQELMVRLADDMEQAAAELEYERAAVLRDQLGQLQHVQASQGIEHLPVRSGHVGAEAADAVLPC